MVVGGSSGGGGGAKDAARDRAAILEDETRVNAPVSSRKGMNEGMLTGVDWGAH